MKPLLFTFLLVAVNVFCIGQNVQYLSPNVAGPQQQLMVSITGQNTNFTSGTDSVMLKYYTVGSSTWEQIDATNISVIDDTTMTVDFIFNTAQTGNWDVEITTVMDGLIFMDDGVFITSPSPSLSVSSAEAGQTLTVGVTGQYTAFDFSTGFNFYQGGTFTNNFDATNVIVNSTLSATAEISIPINMPQGMYHMAASYQGVIATTFNAFEIIASPGAMMIDTVYPYNVLEGESVTFTVNGQNFPSTFTDAYFYTMSDTIHADSLNVINGGELTLDVNLPLNSSGVYGLTLVNDSIVNYFNAISISNNPIYDTVLTSFSQDTLHFNDSLTVSITGQNTAFTSGVNYVRLHHMASSTITIEGVNFVATNDSTLSVDFDMPSSINTGYYNLEVNQGTESLFLSNATFVAPPDDSTGIISGNVTSYLKNTMTVYLHNYSMNIIDSAGTDINGYFEFNNLSWGTYYLTISDAPDSNPYEIILVYSDNVFTTADFVITSEGEFGVLYIAESAGTMCTIFPNPTDRFVTVQYENVNNYPTQVSIIDIHGRELMNKISRENFTSFDLSTLDKGIYIVIVNIENQIYTSKILFK